MYCENQIIQTCDNLTPRCSYVCALNHKCKIEMIYLGDLGVRRAENGKWQETVESSHDLPVVMEKFWALRISERP
jgi:hypothetical protein